MNDVSWQVFFFNLAVMLLLHEQIINDINVVVAQASFRGIG